jgi:hypothetical protein
MSDVGAPLLAQNLFNEAGVGNSLYPSIVGHITLLPFRPSKLAQFGWYFANGETTLLSSDQGKVLNGFDEDYKSDWGIVISGNLISYPNWFTATGKGYFPRAVDGSSRLPGSIQDDAMREIQSPPGINSNVNHSILGGWSLTTTLPVEAPFYSENVALYATISNGSNLRAYLLKFKASLADGVLVADENRPKNVGMTPAIYLGVKQ